MLNGTLLWEAGAPRWQFRYGNPGVDPTPDALVLGTWQHPGTGNELVGGINLHYLSPQQIVKLQRVLPQIMRGNSLKQRYWLGRQLLPGVFGNFYRTYRSDLINRIRPSELPYWVDKQERARLDKAAQQRVRQRQQQQAKHQAMQRAQAMQVEPKPLDVAAGAPARPAPARPAPAPTPAQRQQQLGDRQRAGLQQLQRLANQQKQRAAELSALQQQQQQIRATERARRELEQQRAENLRQLQEPDPEQAGEGDPLAAESITYWSPVQNRYITELVNLA